MGIPLEVQAKPRMPVYFDGEVIGYVNYMRQGDRIPLERPSMNWIGTIECYAMVDSREFVFDGEFFKSTAGSICGKTADMYFEDYGVRVEGLKATINKISPEEMVVICEKFVVIEKGR